MRVNLNRDSKKMMADINIIPLVDVVLVLLVIFMITAPYLYRGIDINLPQSGVNTINSEERAVLTLGKDLTLVLDKEPVFMSTLQTTLEERKNKNNNITLYLRADKDIPYGSVIEVMDIIKKSGIEKLGMITEPLRK